MKNCKKKDIYNQKYYSKFNPYRNSFRFQVQNFLRAFYIKKIFNPKKVLDVGCGMGNLVEMFRRARIEAFGIEISDYALSCIPRSLRQYFQKGDIAHLPFADNEFDLVTTVSLLEHLPRDEISQAIKECARVAKKGIYQEITVLEDRTTIHKDPTHVSKYKAFWWLDRFKRELPGWEVKQGFRLPIFKNGIFIISS